MTNREDGLVEIYERIKLNRTSIGITTFKRTPTQPVRQEDLPCIFMSEDVDNVIEHSKRNKTGYPARRVLEVVLEIVTDRNTDIKDVFNSVRTAIFTERNSSPVVYTPILAENIFISENRTEGPTGYGLPDVLGMRIVLDMVYIDKGF